MHLRQDIGTFTVNAVLCLYPDEDALDSDQASLKKQAQASNM